MWNRVVCRWVPTLGGNSCLHLQCKKMTTYFSEEYYETACHIAKVQILKEIPCCYGSRTFIRLFIEPVYGAFRGLLKSSPHVHNPLLQKIRLNIMLPYTPWSPYSSIPIRVTHQNGYCIYKSFNLCYMYHQSQKPSWNLLIRMKMNSKNYEQVCSLRYVL
jgi:hypothetical protein